MKSQSQMARSLVLKAQRDSLSYFAKETLGFEVTKYQKDWYNLIENEKIRKFLLLAPRNHAKSTIISINAPLWFVGRNHEIRIIIVSNTASQAESFLRSIKSTIERDEKYKETFGDLMPRYPEKWTEREIIVNRDTKEKDPTISTVGTGGAILSKRADVIICDDILNKDNTRTVDQRKKVKEWFNDILMPVLDPHNGRLFIIGTAFNLEDLYHDLIFHDPTFDIKLKFGAVIKESDKQDLWKEYENLMLTEGKEAANDYYEKNKDNMNDAKVLWPERWSYRRLVDERLSVGTRSFNLMYQNEAISDETAVFKEEWIEKCKDEDRALIDRYDPAVSDLGSIIIAQGVDLAIKEDEKADWTVDLTAAKLNNNKFIVLNCVKGHWSPADIRNTIRGQNDNFKPSLILVEDNAFQASLVKDMQDQTTLPIRGFTTTGEKFDEEVGINSLAVSFENGQWILPANPRDHRTVDFYQHLKEDMMKFPSGHTGDLLMALWFAFTALRSLKSGDVVRVKTSGMYKGVSVGA